MNIWKKIRRSNLFAAREFLEEREHFCVNAISRLNSGTVQNIWAAFEGAADTTASVSALLLYGNRMLFPVFRFSSEKIGEFKNNGMPLPLLFSLVLKGNSLHAAQGLADDMDLLENALEKKGVVPASKYDYELRSFDCSMDIPVKTPPGLTVRKAEYADIDELFPLQAAYEKEEVLPKGAEFNPALCRRVLESLIASNMVITAEIGGRLVGKININAQSYNRFQIGGNYVLPEYRSRGIARAMTAALIREFSPQKNHFTLFVKKINIPARKVYDNLGFKKIADYRITYFS